jgi:tetratricopeptide (TPR) repeat protein
MQSASRDHGDVQIEQARDHLNRLLASSLFQRNPRQATFLKFVAEKTLAGEAAQIREHEIAVHVYDRQPDPETRAHRIVRSEAARLRARLQEYYTGEGRDEPVRIALRKGTYVPDFVPAPHPPAVADSVRKRGGSEKERESAKLVGMLVVAGIAIAAVAAVAAVVWTMAARRGGSPLSISNSRVPASIAVLPIRVEGSIDGGDSLGAAVTDALVAEMSQTGFPPYRSRTVIRKAEADRAPKTEAVLRGSISTDGTVLRALFSAEHVSPKIPLWNAKVERKLADWPESRRAALVEDIASAAASSLNQALLDRMEQELAHAYPPRTRARHEWQAADELWQRGDEPSVRRAIGMLESAATVDPNFAWNHASLAQAYIRALELGILPDVVYRERAHQEAARALELAPFLPFVHAAKARVALALDADVQSASGVCKNALAMFSASYAVRRQCAQVYSIAGNSQAAAALDEKNVQRQEQKTVPLTELAWVRFRARQYAEADTLAGQALELDRTYVSARCVAALAKLAQGRAQDALTVLEEAPLDRTGRVNAVTATILALTGDVLGAQEELTKAVARLRRPDQADLIRPYLALRLGPRATMVIDDAMAQSNVNLLELMADPQILELDREGLFERVRTKP